MVVSFLSLTHTLLIRAVGIELSIGHRQQWEEKNNILPSTKLTKFFSNTGAPWWSKYSPYSTHHRQHMQQPIYNILPIAKCTATTQNTPGKLTNSYLAIACINGIDRKIMQATQPQQGNPNTQQSNHLTPQSPNTRVYGKGWFPENPNNKTKLKLTFNIIIKRRNKTTTKLSMLTSKLEHHLPKTYVSSRNNDTTKKTLNTSNKIKTTKNQNQGTKLIHTYTINKPICPPLQNPHTRIYGKRKYIDTNKHKSITQNPKTKITKSNKRLTHKPYPHTLVNQITYEIKYNPHIHVCRIRWVYNTTNNILNTKTKRIINTKTSRKLGINKNISHTTKTLPKHTHKKRDMEINTSKTTPNIKILKHSHTLKQKENTKSIKRIPDMTKTKTQKSHSLEKPQHNLKPQTYANKSISLPLNKTPTYLKVKSRQFTYQEESNKAISFPTKSTLVHSFTTMHKDKTKDEPLVTTHKHILPTIILASNLFKTKTKTYPKPHINTHKLKRLLNPYTYETKEINIKHEQNKIKPNLSLKPKVTITNYGVNCRAKMTAGTQGASRDLTADPDFSMREANSPPQGTKRSGNNKSTSAEKKTKPTPKELIPTRQFWLGFEMMERLAIDEGASLIPTPTSIHTLIRAGFPEKEAKDFLNAVPSFPRVSQSLFPTSRPDGIAGQHYNITQLPFEIDTDPDTGLSHDYQVAIFLQKPIRQYTHEEILALAQARRKEMRIALGNKIAEPIAILCRNGSARHWAGTIKLHLKHPGVDGINLLSGTRPFMLTLGEVLRVGKVCKSYNTIAKNNLLSVKISSPSLSNVTGHALFKEVLEESFKRSHELEISGVQKNVAETWAWLVAPTPTQAEKIVKFKAAFRNEIIPTTIKTGERLSITQLAKKNCLMLVLQGLKLTKTVEETLHEIIEIMGARNVASNFFPKQRENLHSGSVNIECLNATVYHQFVNKTHKIHNSHVAFTPHPKSLEGSLPPTEDQQKQFGFCDINSALVNTLEAIQNAPGNQKLKAKVDNKDISNLKL